MVGVAQLVEHGIVIPEVVGSNPIVHPILLNLENLGDLEALYRAISSIGRAVDS